MKTIITDVWKFIDFFLQLKIIISPKDYRRVQSSWRVYGGDVGKRSKMIGVLIWFLSFIDKNLNERNLEYWDFFFFFF